MNEIETSIKNFSKTKCNRFRKLELDLNEFDIAENIN